MKLMRFLVLFCICLASTVGGFEALGKESLARLAVLAGPEVGAAADLLTVELSGRTNVALLERSEIARIVQEQKLATSGLGVKESIQVGQILGADGLLTLGVVQAGTNVQLVASLIAVRQGVVLEVMESPWPLKEMGEWAKVVGAHFQPYLPKLGVLPKDAIPISILNLRSSAGSAESKELEHGLTELLINRLTHERELFVLERRRLDKLTTEKQFSKTEDAPFWNGSYLLEGIIDKNGYSKEEATISARLSAPGGKPVELEVSGKRNNPGQLIEQLTRRVLEALQKQSTAPEWRPEAEAAQYFEEAKWALKWGLTKEAQAAAESAWALGKKTREMSVLRLNTYMEDSATVIWKHRTPNHYTLNDYDIKYDITSRFPDSSAINPLLRTLELFCQDSHLMLTNRTAPDQEWLILGLGLITRADGLLESFYHGAEARAGHEMQLAEIRSRVRESVAILKANAPEDHDIGEPCQGDGCLTLKLLEWEDGGLWHEKPEETLQMDRQMMEAGLHPLELPWVIGWSWQDRKQVPRLLKRFVEDLCQSTNPSVRLEGLYLAVARAPFDQEGTLQASESRLFEAIWQQRHAIPGKKEYAPGRGYLIVSGKTGPPLLDRTEEALKRKYDYLPDEVRRRPFEGEPFASFRTRLRKDYLSNPASYLQGAFSELFPESSIKYTENEAREFIPLLESLRQRLGEQSGENKSITRLVEILSNRLGVAVKQSAPSPETFRQSVSSIPTGGQLKALTKIDTSDIFTFIDWKTEPPQIEPGRGAEILREIFRNGRLWFEVRYKGEIIDPLDYKAFFVSVEPKSGVGEVIPFPHEMGIPDPNPRRLTSAKSLYEVTEDSLFVSVQDHLQRYRFNEKRWEKVEVPMQLGAALTAIDGLLYVNTGDTIFRLSPATGKLDLLASNRRHPGINVLDEAGRYGAVFAGPDGTVRVTAGNQDYMPTREGKEWERVKPAPPGKLSAANLAEKMSLTFDSSRQATLLWRKTGSSAQNRIPVGFEMGGHPADPFGPFAGHSEVSGEPFHFDTPEGMIVVPRTLTGHWLVPKAAFAASHEGVQKP